MWLKDLKANSSPDVKIFLIGNKVDLEEERIISKEMAEKFKNDYDLDFFMETSAKTGFNTQELFVKAAKVLFEDYNEYKKNKKIKINDDDNDHTVQLVEKDMNKDNSRCC
jgi:GTPase SAR1 family protein